MAIERTLEGIISPMRVVDFFADHWEQHPLHISRNDPTAHHEILRLDDFESLVAATPVDHHWVGVDASVSAAFVDDNNVEHRYQLRTDTSHRPRLSAVHEALANGHSVVVRHVRKSWGPVAELCAGMEQGLQHVVHCNAFLTPPRSRAYPAHFDTSDTFFVQIAGSKTWRFGQPSLPLPVQASPAMGGARPDDIEVILQQGDALFLPRGWVHHATTGVDPSLHITIGTEPVRWLDVAIEALKAAAQTDERLRESVGFDYPDADHTARITQVLQDLRVDSSHNGLAAIRARLLEAQPDLHSPLAAQMMGKDADLGTTVRHAPGLGLVSTIESESVRLSGSGSFVSGPLQARALFEYIAMHPSFIVRDLPTDVSDETKLEVVNELLRQGLLRR